jgi:HSP20 family protein
MLTAILKEGFKMIMRRLTGWPTMGWRNPLDELDFVRRELGRLAQGLTGGSIEQPSAGVFPAVNVTEDKDNFFVRAELPGIKADDLDISITGKTVTIAGERKASNEGEGVKYHRRERDSGRFSRVISLPSDIDVSKVEARSTDGILTVVLPKAETTKPKQIKVKAA